MTDAAVAEQRVAFGDWLRRHAGDAPLVHRETHVSLLALGETRVWKLKKAVHFPFIDLSTPELRRANAEREVMLNRRFAPDVYLHVLPLESAEGAIVDTVVEMRRMPDARRLEFLARTADPTACIDRIAQELVRVHGEAPTGAAIDRAGLPTNLLHLWATNLDELAAFTRTELDATLLARIDDDGRRYLTGRKPLFRRRIADSRVRDGHGDLLAEDVFCLDDGPRFLDCLEFDDELRFGDVLADVTFLAMDLERLGRRDLADRLLDRYRIESGDDWPASLADYYIAYRALVRAKIACLRADIDSAAGASGRALLALAAGHLARGSVRLVLVGGAPATGKSTLTRELARRTGWPAVRADEVRKRLAGLEPTTPAANELDRGLYTADWTTRTYDTLLDTARTRLAAGESVVLDASWSDTRHRADAAHVAEETASVLVAFELDVPAAVADARASRRAASQRDASDAGASALTGALRSRFAAWPEAVRLDGTQPVPVLARRALEEIGPAPDVDQPSAIA